MSEDLTPGSTLQIKVKRTPTNQAAAKTLSRIFAKDPVNRKQKARRKKLLVRAVEHRRRGGRLWAVRPKVPRMFQPETGAACTLLATSDVIADLRSVKRFVEVTRAT